ncbi:MAG: glutamate-1-semialdehyde 2,1-aminomutase [Candidatus Obscuribacterales bacterium]|nr:glutamate-1-semialdehyde 2,1-aminomutase [Candidatus Obscuribacterales bacterium]
MNTLTAHNLKTPNSQNLSREIEQLIPGGVNSPFRSYHEVGGHAIFIDRGSGSKVFDADDNEYIDYVGAWGPAILGHSYAPVVEAVKRVINDGPMFGAPHKLELELARKLVAGIPSVEMVRFVNSGTEAVMSALRLARGYTGRDTIVMFEGGYHGHSDSVLASSTHKHSSGIPDQFCQNTVLTPFNDLPALEKCLSDNKGKIAAVIIEPVAGSMGVIAEDPGFLSGVRELTKKHHVLLIFDEVLTGFRVAFGGAQGLYDVEPDLTCFGKALGGGMPIGAYGGKKTIMQKLMPLGDVYQAGTFSGNPVTMAGANAILDSLSQPGVYETLEALGAKLFDGLRKSIDKINQKDGKSIPVQLQRVGSMFAIIFAPHPIRNFEDSKSIDNELFASFFHKILANGIMLPPSAVDAACLSLAHTEEDIKRTVDLCSSAFTSLFG